jgi:hypothetical protein
MTPLLVTVVAAPAPDSPPVPPSATLTTVPLARLTGSRIVVASVWKLLGTMLSSPLAPAPPWPPPPPTLSAKIPSDSTPVVTIWAVLAMLTEPALAPLPPAPPSATWTSRLLADLGGWQSLAFSLRQGLESSTVTELACPASPPPPPTLCA